MDLAVSRRRFVLPPLIELTSTSGFHDTGQAKQTVYFYFAMYSLKSDLTIFIQRHLKFILVYSC